MWMKLTKLRANSVVKAINRKVKMKFNLNHYIRVRLTEKGRYLHRSRHQKLMTWISENNGRGIEYIAPEVDKDGFCRFQGWDLMALFGPYMGMGSDLPLETEVIIEES